MSIRDANSRLAARVARRQTEVSRRADAAANTVDRAAGQLWGAVLRLLRDRPAWMAAQVRAEYIFSRLLPELEIAIVGSLARLTRWGHLSAVDNIRRTLPVEVLARAAASVRRPLIEDESSDPLILFRDLFARLRGEPAPDDAHEYLLSLLFPAPTGQEVDRIIYAGDWQARLAAGTRLAAPTALASVVAGGMAAGQTPRQIAQQLLPVVDGVRSSARRIARTEALRVAAAMQMDCHRQLGDLVIGYTVHSAFSTWTRPWHRERSGTAYYLDPAPGQKGMRQCPHPPQEAEDPAERPAGAPQTAWNCLCWLTPILRG